jgi:hypothetical protein
MQVEARRRRHEARSGGYAPTGAASDAIRSWIERTSRSRERMAISASQAADVADIVVMYGTL